MSTKPLTATFDETEIEVIANLFDNLLDGADVSISHLTEEQAEALERVAKKTSRLRAESKGTAS